MSPRLNGQSPLRPASRLRAVTLMEVVIATALLVVVLGVLMDMLITMRRDTERAQNRLQMQTEAAMVADQLSAVFAHAVKPGAIDGGTSATLAFAADKCSILSSKNFSGKKMEQITFTSSAEKNRQGRVISENQDGVKVKLGLRTQDRFNTKVAFQYATAALVPGPDNKGDNFKTALQPGEFPRLVRATITVADSLKQIKPYVLTEAIRLP